jgi:hypothetical protein
MVDRHVGERTFASGRRRPGGEPIRNLPVAVGGAPLAGGDQTTSSRFRLRVDASVSAGARATLLGTD